MSTQTMSTEAPHVFITPEKLLEHWEGHRRLTRRTLEVFPEGQLFTFMPAPPMRSFGALALEVIHMVEPTLQGLLTGEWMTLDDWSEKQKGPPPTKAELLGLWDEANKLIREEWPRIPVRRFHEIEPAFGLPPQPNRNLVLYLLDNEVHHRAQGYVYLRLLGIEPPAFYER